MTLEQQCVSLEIAKRLKELGVKQESYFFWTNYKDGWKITPIGIRGGTIGLMLERMKGDGRIIPKDVCSAFTVAELGILLPEKTCWRGYSNNGKKWGIEFGDFRAEAESEADCKGKMLIYLLENKLITL